MPLQFELAKSSRRIVIDPILPSVTVGALTGASGLVAGGFAGVLISQHPALFSITAAVQCFSLGSSFWYFRSVLFEAGTESQPTRSEKLKYSALAGSLSGALNGAFRSKANILPGALMIGLMGLAGQAGYDMISVAQQSQSTPRPSLVQQLTESKWVPLRALSDQQYEEMLRQKLLKVEVEISMIDEKIASLKGAKQDSPPVGSKDDTATA